MISNERKSPFQNLKKLSLFLKLIKEIFREKEKEKPNITRKKIRKKWCTLQETYFLLSFQIKKKITLNYFPYGWENSNFKKIVKTEIP